MYISGKILLTGANGQLGSEIVNLAKKLNLKLYPVTRTQLNITNLEQIEYIAATIKPNYIINTAAYTAVDNAEKESELAFSVNALGVKYLAKIAQKHGIPLLHISTDYIFDGQKKAAYYEEDHAQPLSVYGQSKLSGENFLRNIWYKHIILRVSWMFGVFGNNFVKTIMRLAREQNELRIITDQKGSPTYAADVAQVLLKIINCLDSGQSDWGTYHYTGTPAVSWYGFARKILNEAKQHQPFLISKIIPIVTSEYPRIAHRPFNSELVCKKITQTFDIKPNNWSDGLYQVIKILL